MCYCKCHNVDTFHLKKLLSYVDEWPKQPQYGHPTQTTNNSLFPPPQKKKKWVEQPSSLGKATNIEAHKITTKQLAVNLKK